MFNNQERKGLKAWVRFDGNNNAVAGSLIFQKNKPKVGKWKEYKDVNLCCPSTDCNPNYSPWRLVTGGVAGDGTVLIDDNRPEAYTFVGPNDNTGNGWVYLTQYFATETCLDIDYQYTTFDESLIHDYPVYWTSSTEPTGEPGDTTPQVSTSPESGTWSITIPAGQWFSIGLYSDDSCCGRGFLTISITPVECTTTTTTTALPVSAYSYVISATDLAAATGNADTNLNGKVFALTADDGSGSPASRVFNAAGSFNHWLCSADPIVPTFGYYANDVFITAGLISTQTNIGVC